MGPCVEGTRWVGYGSGTSGGGLFSENISENIFQSGVFRVDFFFWSGIVGHGAVVASAPAMDDP